ncbi:protein of unknown function DUF4216 [Dillenia turbinata]|uniref:DUF4216 domain-containing protein n=1 Tax=Dillenia turbinata TaxID=194707 RepID=A0AAN8YSI1_9MAGN
MVNATTSSFASTKDKNPISSDLCYYGILKDVLELHYIGGQTVVLFDCNWVLKGSRLKQDADGFTLVNFENVKRHNEPFVLASQVKQVFYVEDPLEKGWQVIIPTAARKDLKMDLIDVENYLQTQPSCSQSNLYEEISWMARTRGGRSNASQSRTLLTDENIEDGMDIELEPNTGLLARMGKFALIDIDDWRNMPKSCRKEMIDVMKENFDIPLGLEENTLKSLGKKWRDWKSELRTKHFDPKETTTRQILNRLARVLPNQWRKFLVKCRDEKHKEKELGHPLSQADLFSLVYFDSNGNPSSDAVAEKCQQMKDISAQLPLGVTKADPMDDIPSRSACYRMVKEHSVSIAKMAEKLQQLEAMQRVRDKVSLRSIGDSNKTVAIGVVESLDRQVMVCRQPLGSHWCTVHVNMAIDFDE